MQGLSVPPFLLYRHFQSIPQSHFHYHHLMMSPLPRVSFLKDYVRQKKSKFHKLFNAKSPKISQSTCESQQDLELGNCAGKWLLPINSGKCDISQLGKSIPARTLSYSWTRCYLSCTTAVWCSVLVGIENEPAADVIRTKQLQHLKDTRTATVLGNIGQTGLV